MELSKTGDCRPGGRPLKPGGGAATHTWGRPLKPRDGGFTPGDGPLGLEPGDGGFAPGVGHSHLGVAGLHLGMATHTRANSAIFKVRDFA